MMPTTSLTRGLAVPRNTIAAPALQPRERHAQKVPVAADHKPALDKFLDLNVRIGAGLARQSRARREI
jgi:hypothetical protein